MSPFTNPLDGYTLAGRGYGMNTGKPVGVIHPRNLSKVVYSQPPLDELSTYLRPIPLRDLEAFLPDVDPG